MKKVTILILSVLCFFALPVFAKTYTIDEISKHNKATDCWMLISGKVYDVTSYFGGQHPSGDGSMLPYCGIDATEGFSTKGNIGEDHKIRSYDLLTEYYIGDFQEETIVNKTEKVVANEISNEAKIEVNQAEELGTTAIKTKEEVEQNAIEFKYPSAIVSVAIILFIYLILGIIYLLSSNKPVFKLKITKFTSVVLFITFIFSGLLGLYLAFFDNAYWGELLNLKSIHVAFSVAFAISSIIHIILHLKQILNYLAILKQKDNII
ncbi:MAG: cytochrome b5 domain-containing protein [Patescibacteria group bacterium]|nr:cytochrome b5 domain-containing protein [Patescibacteria group bacterium]